MTNTAATNTATPTMPRISLDMRYLTPDVTPDQIQAQQSRLQWSHETLANGTGAGAEYRGWLDIDSFAGDALVSEIETIAADLRANSDVLVVIGIGGSYLGARAVIEALADTDKIASVLFAGQNLSARYHTDLLSSLQNKRVALNAVSKSGTTTEPAVAFRLLRQLVETQANGDTNLAKSRIVATTDTKKGALRKVADAVGYRTLPIADDIGGRYSVLSPVGLLPIAYAGIDIRALLRGAKEMAGAVVSTPDPAKNPVLAYAAGRNLLYNQGFGIEVLSSWEPRLHYVLEWWKQLFGESEGKDHMALYPSSMEFTTDLHSLGQYMQEGRRQILETFLVVDDGEPVLNLSAGDSADELDYLQGRPLTEINHAAYQATALAHRTGGVPNQTIHLPKLDAYNLGALLYFFERACPISGYLLGVNPFDQPGVEAYKKNMFALLSKPGFEAQTQELREKVGAGDAASTVRFA